METYRSSICPARELSMSQPSAELEKLQDELVEKKDLVIEAHQKLREERRASYDVKIALRSAEEKLATDRKSTRLNSSHEWISYAVFCLKKKKKKKQANHTLSTTDDSHHCRCHTNT